MKVVPPKEVTKVTSKILLPLEEDPEEMILTKSNSVGFDLSTNPGTGGAPV